MSGYTRDQAFGACMELQGAMLDLREPLLHLADADARTTADLLERLAITAGRIAAYIDPALDGSRHPHPAGTA